MTVTAQAADCAGAEDDEDDVMADQEAVLHEAAPVAAAQAAEQHAEQLMQQLQEAGSATPQRTFSFSAKLESTLLSGQVMDSHPWCSYM